MEIVRNIVIKGTHGKPIAVDLFYEQNNIAKPIVIFAHGFKGFKDWGTFDLVGKQFAEAGFFFLKFNFSHNGTTPENPSEFTDLEAFGQNNFSIELDDLGSVIDWLESDRMAIPGEEVDLKQINLIGHSRGGGIAILKASEDSRIKKLVTWAAVSVFGRFWDDERQRKWKADGVMYVRNGRTNQDMPLYYQIHENLFANKDRLDIPSAAKNLKIPYLIVHGTADEAVPIKHALDLYSWSGNSRVVKIENGGHTFGGKHPWDEEALPKDLQSVVEQTANFFKY